MIGAGVMAVCAQDCEPKDEDGEGGSDIASTERVLRSPGMTCNVASRKRRKHESCCTVDTMPEGKKNRRTIGRKKKKEKKEGKRKAKKRRTRCIS